MTLQYHNANTNAEFRLIFQQENFDRKFYGKDRKDKLLTIAWNVGGAQQVTVDGIPYDFPANTVLPLMINQSFHFDEPKSIVAWQFNRDFYCIVNHDKEVGCVGFLFYGTSQYRCVALTENDAVKLDMLLHVFKDEFDNADDIQGEMLRMLLVRLIITITRLAKQQCYADAAIDTARFTLFRRFNVLVEEHYKTEHGVKFYAAALNKSPKTLSNVFALYERQTPLQIIQNRIILEARRLFNYTDKSSKEVAADLGFDDASHFSRFFKNQTGKKTSDVKKEPGSHHRE